MAERKQKREAAAAKKAAAMAPKPFEPGEQEKLLADLASGDNERIQAAAERLARVVRKDEPADAVGRALIAALKDRNPNVKKDIWKAARSLDDSGGAKSGDSRTQKRARPLHRR